MNMYPDYRSQNEQEMYEYFKSKDYSKERKWQILFSSHNGFLKAIKDMTHPFHKEAMQIRENRVAKRSYAGVDGNGDRIFYQI